MSFISKTLIIATFLATTSAFTYGSHSTTHKTDFLGDTRTDYSDGSYSTTHKTDFLGNTRTDYHDRYGRVVR